MNKRCIGFAALVHDFEYTLFSRNDFGIVDSGVRATKVDLYIPMYQLQITLGLGCRILSGPAKVKEAIYSQLLASSARPGLSQLSVDLH